MQGSKETYCVELLGKSLVLEFGKYSELANGSCFVRYGETVVGVTVCCTDKPKEDVDFFPLSVDYEEKFYACGRVPASFGRREGKPSERAILTARLIDRSIRPLFPKDLRNEVSVVCTVFSMDPDSSPEIASIVGTSAALCVSDVPWDGPIAATNVGIVGDRFLFNPSSKLVETSDMLTTVVSTSDLVTMVEAAAKEVPDEIVMQAIREGHRFNQKIISFIENIQKGIGKGKRTYEKEILCEDIFRQIADFSTKDLKCALQKKEKSERAASLSSIYEGVRDKFSEIYPDYTEKFDNYLYLLQKEIVRTWIYRYGKRVDGRKLDELRKLSAEVGLLPRAHGSAVFTRGQTQVLSTVTLGSIKDRQLVDNLYGEHEKRYIHHYNFPAYSVGEARSLRAPGRREIGHGALAERALLPVIPKEEDFPYTIRVVSDVLSSNGSTSQGSVCGSTLALMDAGVPITSPVAGISCGLVFKDKDHWVTMVDIQGLEDFFGDMDFKVAGTEKGITAIQVDTKIRGLSFDIIEEALRKTREARAKILNDVILKTISRPRKSLSKYAPKLVVGVIAIDKIKDVIGSGGKVVQKLCADYDCKVEIADDGKVFINGSDIEKCKEALEIIKSIAREVKVGEIYSGKVTKVVKYGAFVEIFPGKEGFCHISQLDNKRIENIDDFVKSGDPILVKIVEIDAQGKINLSRKDAMPVICK